MAGGDHTEDRGDVHDGIQVRGLTRSFGPVQAVAGMDLDARPGRVTALVGPNGSGKTTLLLIVAGLLRPDTGTVRVAGHDPVTQPAEVHARLGWMPDAFGAWDSLTAREHLTTYAAAYRLPRARHAARADELLALVQLAAWADAPARALSRGQKQRLGLARTLVHEPAVVVLDEPASGLDPGSRVALRVLLRRLATEGRTVLVSSHVLSDLDETADDAVYVLGGRTVDPGEAAGAAAGTWRVRALDPRALDAAFVELGVTALSQPDGSAEVSAPDEAAAARLLADLVGRGVDVVAFAPAAGRIERTYLGLAHAAATSSAASSAALSAASAESSSGPSAAGPPPPGTVDGEVILAEDRA